MCGDNEFNTCRKCREKGRRSDKRRSDDPEIKSRRNEQQRLKEYSKLRRERRKIEDPEGLKAEYREHSKQWRENHREELNQKAKITVNRRLNSIKNSAKKREKAWNITDDFAKELMIKPCHYCGLIQLDVMVNGIDRVNNDIGYEYDNVVSCCKLCNYFKKNYTVDTFLSHVKRIFHNQINLGHM